MPDPATPDPTSPKSTRKDSAQLSAENVEKHSFQADVNEVLSIVVNSLYSNKEIFLRELISNASDALDKLSFNALTDHELKGSRDPEIEILADREARTLTIRDSGAGMTKEELVSNLGTIARSGSRELTQSLTGDQKKDLTLIGQFGVGFYSAYLVADRVSVLSRAAGSKDAYRWQSDAKDEFVVEPSTRDHAGTDVVLHLKDAEEQYLDEWEIKRLVRKYSDYVRYPIKLWVERKKGPTEKEGESSPELESEWEVINTASAIWTRSKSDVTQDQYDEFYKHLSHDWRVPLAQSHFRVEGTQELSGLIFIPEVSPIDLFEQQSRGVRLFVRRVFIMDDAEELLPEWLRFVRGVVDSEDLPLNVSRELLQQDRSSRFIRKQVVNKSLSLLEELATEGETTRYGEGGKPAKVKRYDIFWREFGRVLKEGVHYEQEHRERIAKLLRYHSSRDEGLVGLETYIGRMQDGQESIYYISADSLEAAQGSPHIEALKARGIEVLFMTEPVDEWVVQSLVEFEEKPLVSAVKGALDLPEDDGSTEEEEKNQGEFEALLTDMQGALDARVKEVRLTHRLTESPACLVVDEQGMSPYMERILKANGREVPAQKRILELNPGHPVVRSILHLSGDDDRKQEIGEWSQLLFDQALVAEGSLPEDPAEFARNVTKLMQRAVSIPEPGTGAAESDAEAADADIEAIPVGMVPAADTPPEVEVVTHEEDEPSQEEPQQEESLAQDEEPLDEELLDVQLDAPLDEQPIDEEPVDEELLDLPLDEELLDLPVDEEESAPVADLDDDGGSLFEEELAGSDPFTDEEPEEPEDSEKESTAEP